MKQQEMSEQDQRIGNSKEYTLFNITETGRQQKSERQRTRRRHRPLRVLALLSLGGLSRARAHLSRTGIENRNSDKAVETTPHFIGRNSYSCIMHSKHYD
jgi:hypothetical protein